MIVVEVEFPMMGRRYDFQIEETAPFWKTREEIARLVCRKEQCRINGSVDGLCIWSEDGRKLSIGQTAAEAGIRTGSRLIIL